MNQAVTKYLASSKSWREETDALRDILVGCGLDEDIKWRQLCYAHEGKNVVIIQKMKAFLSLMFFKGALLKDPKGLLKKPGKHSNSGRRFEFTSVRDVTKAQAAIKRYVREAIAIEEAGLKVPKPSRPSLPKELRDKFKRDPEFQAAFKALTPGRQRGYSLFFSDAKSSEARARRIAKHERRILDGKGLHDR